MAPNTGHVSSPQPGFLHLVIWQVRETEWEHPDSPEEVSGHLCAV